MYDNQTANKQHAESAALQQGRQINAAVETATPIRDVVSGSEQVLSQVHELISQLETRLDTVLAPAPPTANSTSAPRGSGTMGVSHVHGRLAILNDGYQQAAARLYDLIRRVEV